MTFRFLFCVPDFLGTGLRTATGGSAILRGTGQASYTHNPLRFPRNQRMMNL